MGIHAQSGFFQIRNQRSIAHACAAPILHAFIALALSVSLPAPVCARSASPPRSGRDAILARAGWIKIGLQRGTQSVRVSLPAGGRAVSPQGEFFQSRQGASLQANSDRGAVCLSADGKTLGRFSSIAIEPASPSGGGWFQLGSNRYRGRLLLLARGSGFDAVNQIQIDDYLKGVLPAEIGSSHVEALKAQAVAARSEAVRKLAHPPHEGQGYDFCTGVHCQAYKGMNVEEEPANAACDATFGMVLMADGEVVDAVYHSVCGGVTAGAEDVWDGPPEAGIVPVFDTPVRRIPDLGTDAAVAEFLKAPSTDTYCNPSQPDYPNYAKKHFRWQKTLDAGQLQKAAGVGRVRDVAVVQRCASGRVRKLQITGDSRSRVIDKELPIRNAFDLWSGFFVVQVQKAGGYVQSATFYGAGNGHGAGLCQMGARTMALRGLTYDKILAHYYRGARLAQIYKP